MAFRPSFTDDQGKVVVVTGASSDLGRAIGLRFRRSCETKAKSLA